MATLEDVLKQGRNAIAEGAKAGDVNAWIDAWKKQPDYAKSYSFEDVFNARKGSLEAQGGFDENGNERLTAADAARNYKNTFGVDISQELDPNAWVGKAYGSELLGLKSGSSAGDVTNDANAALRLAQLKRIIPTATIDDQGRFQFDQSKLPQFMGGKVSTDASKGGGWVNAPIHTGQSGHVLDNRYVYKDPIYGDVTYRQNTFDPASDGNGGFMGQLGKYMPSVISAVMSIASGIPVASLVQGLAGADAGGWGGASIANLLRIIGSSVANSYVPGSGTAINLAAGAAQRGR